MIERRADLRGTDDFVAEIALSRRACRPADAASSFCRRRFTHPRRPTRFDERGFLVIDTCHCLLPTGHDLGCICEHAIERRVFRIDADGREHYATRPLAKPAPTSGRRQRI
ncbi:MAG: hypothetical protein DME00_00705 [Candidatus Rokuibacteriota bacterium]|nr:MAG: hypothetical protein DME00_00705 [Candidatus Rokubacteria bacterium]PYO12610.1 MAG: hypothetical protein DMD75_07070 [Candidatus Rokubacteria bacterium]